MNNLLRYTLEGKIASIEMDDGKVNSMSIDMLSQLHSAFDRAENDGALVILSGRAGMFSAGFDLNVFGQGAENVVKMLTLGAQLCEKILSFPMPVLVACDGHAMAMGAFLLLSADYRIGAEGDYTIAMNEVAIGLTVPYFAIEVARQRLSPAEFSRSVITAHVYSPGEALTAGYLDQLLASSELMDSASSRAESLLKLDMKAYSATKLRVREDSLKRLRSAIETELTLENVKAALGET